MQPSPLDEIADVRVGLTLRGADAANRTYRGPEAENRTMQEAYHYLQISDVTEDGRINVTDFRWVDPVLDPSGRYRTRRSDIVVANRGNRMTAALAPNYADYIVSSQLYIVRIKSDEVTSAYVHAYLNLPSTQDYLRSQTRGSYVQTLPIAVLRTLPVPIPALRIQDEIVDLVKCANEERRILAKLSQKRYQYINQSITRLLSNPS